MAVVRTDEARARADPATSGRRDFVVVAAAGLFVVLAGFIGRWLADHGVAIHATAAPLQGRWEIHVGVGSVLAIALAVAVVLAARHWTAQARWSSLVTASMAAAAAWTISLALVDGWDRGFAGRLSRADEYLNDLPRVHDLGSFIRGFTTSIPVDSADPWTTHVSSHPPGALLPFWLLDRIGLQGGAWAALLCILVGASGVGAALVTVRTLGSEPAARQLAPFLALAPAAVWVGVSGDALFLGTSAWGVALLAMACTRTIRWHQDTAALAGGLLLGLSIYLSYGLVLSLLVGAAIVMFYGSVRVGLVALGGTTVVAVMFTVAGFNWWQASHLVVDRYYAGWGGQRPLAYWVWADLAVFALVIGPAAVAGIGRLTAGLSGASARSAWNPSQRVLVVVVGAALVAVVLASMGGLSKGEVERIWLPFAMWASVACAALPGRYLQRWLVGQALLALVIQHVVLTTW